MTIEVNALDAVIFDLDGTLVASECIYLRAWREAATAVGIEISDSLYARLMGYNRSDTIQLLAREWKDEAKALFFIEKSECRFRSIVAGEGVVLREGVRELIRRILDKDMRLAIATSSSRKVAEDVIRRVGIRQEFSVMACGDEVLYRKPNPEIYLKAATKLGVEPRRCLVFEDSTTGVRSAVSAGMTVVCIPELSFDRSKGEHAVRIGCYAEALSWFR